MVMGQSFASSVHDKSSNWIIFEMKQKVCTSLFVFPIFCGFPVHIAERRKKIELEHFASSFATWKLEKGHFRRTLSRSSQCFAKPKWICGINSPYNNLSHPFGNNIWREPLGTIQNIWTPTNLWWPGSSLSKGKNTFINFWWQDKKCVWCWSSQYILKSDLLVSTETEGDDRIWSVCGLVSGFSGHFPSFHPRNTKKVKGSPPSPNRSICLLNIFTCESHFPKWYRFDRFIGQPSPQKFVCFFVGAWGEGP